MNGFKLLCCLCILYFLFTCLSETKIHFTPKVKTHDTQQLSSKIHWIIKEMTEHINTRPSLPIVVYHCDPSLQSGHSGNPKKSEYEYFDDLPYYQSYFKKNPTTQDTREWNMTYGSGGTESIPQTTICDASLLCSLTNPKPESVFVHEIAHTLWNRSFRHSSYYPHIKRHYQDYKQRLQDDCPKVYACQSLEEFFAVVSEVWFGSTQRKDTTKTIETTDIIQNNYPKLYTTLTKMYGPPKDLFHRLCD